MYYWDQPDPAALNGAKRPRRLVDGVDRAVHAGPAGSGTGQAAQAVQVALDRRDNGGDSSAAGDQ
jgi:hypothetical protein